MWIELLNNRNVLEGFQTSGKKALSGDKVMGWLRLLRHGDMVVGSRLVLAAKIGVCGSYLRGK